MVYKLRYHVGQASVGKLITMRKDMEVSKDLWDEYTNKIKDDDNTFDLNVRVLTKSQWPIKSLEEVKMHETFTLRVQRFTNFYKKKFEGRKIN